MTYKNSGVDIEEKEEAIKQLLSSIMTKRKGTIGRPMGGHYAGLIEFGDYALVLCTDGVGTKVRIAEALKKYDTVGIDCIAMNVNDALCVGAEPLAFVDYLAMENPDPKITKEIGKGLEKGAKQSNISIVGGETADLSELINGFDLAGTCLAYVKKDRIILGDAIQPGDAIIGLSSSGIHSNGYTLARRVVEEAELSYTDRFPDGLYPGKTIGEIMLTPTRIYVKEIIELFKKISVHGLAHITGSGLWNIPRLKEKVKYVIEDPLEPQPIFSFLQQYGNIEDYEMYQIFNMGMGLAVIVAEKDVKETIRILQNHSDASVKLVGSVKKGTGVEVPRLKLHYH
ncbi:MAG TPA: phosphoribosylformylglycinamidine cyclo-ligase [Thermoplasmata archaeon]|jgi:phosphoribosylformylglycinamidine cyclo-ligase|nr:MAG TPA: phosphoribosylformylglycinamidine cyclo-ligase [Thermoplasmata archaeon]